MIDQEFAKEMLEAVVETAKVENNTDVYVFMMVAPHPLKIILHSTNMPNDLLVFALEEALKSAKAQALAKQ